MITSSIFLSAVLTAQAGAVEVAPRISDKEIIEKLSALDAKIDKAYSALDAKIDKAYSTLDAKIDKAYSTLDAKIDRETANVRGDIKELRAEMNTLRAEIKAIDKRFDAVDKRFDDLHWTMNLFITISLIILGFVLRMQWQMHKKQAQMETILETQKDELSFLKDLIEKLLPPKGAL